jgi:hypothetical protein
MSESAALLQIVAGARKLAELERARHPQAKVLTKSALVEAKPLPQPAFRPAPQPAAPRELRVLFACEPFVEAASPAGKLMAKIIQAMGLAPSDAELLPAAEIPGALERLKPKALVALGPQAASALGLEGDFGRLRGRFAVFQGLPLMPTQHPLDLLQNESLKRHVWEDMKLVAAKVKE